MSNSDLGERILKQTYRREYTDPLQQELVDVMREQRRLKARRRELIDLLRTGCCEECGAAFVRLRPSKRFCSNACNQKNSLVRRTNASFDLGLIEQHWPVLKVSGLLTDKVQAAVDQILHGKNIVEASEYTGVSRQRISQYLVKADRSARLIDTIQRLIRGPSSESSLHEKATHDLS